ncbi:MAG: methionine--tRNA ligase [Lactobacillaceae bacterium]|jgi:methionyl-tRNA synthetase|nr:methionine--tRNA ligase [Lactobacillaceae bacterium]
MSEEKTFYITTPIYYPSGKLQLGNTYTTVLADALARFHRALGEKTFFLTGTDEHGLKIQQKAKEAHKSEIQYLDEMADDIKNLWKIMDISYDQFIRTTDSDHEKRVQAIFSKLLENGDIYKGQYEGWYSVSDEEYFTESQLAEVFKDENGKIIGGIAPSGHKVELVKEESYFFKMSKYADWLLDYYRSHPEFLQPESRMNEMIKNFIEPGLEDLAVTRTSFDWGVKVPGDEKHVIYVWIDALSNYITALGYDPTKPQNEQDEKFKTFWPANVQLVGKEIVRFHTIYRQIMFHSLGIELPKEVLGHGWLVMKDGKMSKSKGNVIYPETLTQRYGLDAVRYYLLRSMPFGNDGVFSPEDFVNRVNFDLANDLGNLVNRTVSMINKYFDGVVPAINGSNLEDQDLKQVAINSYEKYLKAFSESKTADGLENVWELVRRTNKYIDETKPWELFKNNDLEKLSDAMANLVASLRMIAAMLQAGFTNTPKEIYRQLGLKELESIKDLKFDDVISGQKVTPDPKPIFPRLDVEKEIEFISALVTKDKKGKGRAAMEEAKKEVIDKTLENTNDATDSNLDFNDFMKIKLIAAKIKSGINLENSDKLIKWELDDGTKKGRVILSALRKWYPNPEELVGKTIGIVANLKPRKMAGVVSEGMVLAGENKNGDVILSFLPDEIEAGSSLS